MFLKNSQGRETDNYQQLSLKLGISYEDKTDKNEFPAIFYQYMKHTVHETAKETRRR